MVRVDRPDNEVPSSRHGVGGIDEEVHENLLELPGVGLDGVEVAGQFLVDEDLLPGAVEGLAGLLDEPVEVQGLHLVASLPGVAQELGRKPRSALDLFLDALEPFVEGVLWIELVEHQRDVSLDDHEEVIEVVRDAAGQRPHGLHPLGVVELGLDTAVLADILEHHDEGPLHVVADRQQLDHELAVVELHRAVRRRHIRLGRHTVDHLPHEELVFRVEQGEHARGQQALLRDAGERDGRGVGIDDAAPRGNLEDSLGEAAQDDLEVLPDGEQLLRDLARVEVLGAQDPLRHVLRAPVLGVVQRSGHVLAHLVQRPLGDAGVGPDGPEVDLLLGGGGRQDDEVGLLHLGHGPDDLAELFAVDVGHDQVDEDDVRAPVLQEVQGVQAVFRGADFVPVFAEKLGHVLQDDRVVVHDEDLFLLHAVHPFAAGRRAAAPRTVFRPSRLAWYRHPSACSISWSRVIGPACCAGW